MKGDGSRSELSLWDSAAKWMTQEALVNEVGADEAGAAGDEDVHGHDGSVVREVRGAGSRRPACIMPRPESRGGQARS